MRNSLFLLSTMALNMAIISCTEAPPDEVILTVKKDKTSIKQQKVRPLIKDNIPKVVQKIKPETNKGSSTEETKARQEAEFALLLNSLETSNRDTHTQEQDTGIPLDPDNDEWVYQRQHSLENNETQDTGVYLEPEMDLDDNFFY